jgi:hypothetical protein
VVCRSVRDGIDSAGVGYAGRVARIGCKTCARGVGMGPGHELGGTLQQMRIEFLGMLLYGDIVAQHQESVEDTGQICRSEDRGRLSRAFKAFKGAESPWVCAQTCGVACGGPTSR